jgi:hypothetical protein
VLIKFSCGFKWWKSYCSMSSDTLCADLGPTLSETEVRQIHIQFLSQKIHKKVDYIYYLPVTFFNVNEKMALYLNIFSFFRLFAIDLLFMVKMTLFAYGNALNNGRRFIWLNNSRHIHCLVFKMSLFFNVM